MYHNAYYPQEGDKNQVECDEQTEKPSNHRHATILTKTFDVVFGEHVVH
jgi:hypothetical protein